MADDNIRSALEQASQEVQGNQQNISGEDIAGPVVGGSVEQIGDRTTNTTITNIYNLPPPPEETETEPPPRKGLTGQLTMPWLTCSMRLVLMLAVVAFVGVAGTFGFYYRLASPPPPLCPPTRNCLLLADFTPASSARAGEITTALEQVLNDVLVKTGAANVAIVRVRGVRDRSAAQTLAEEAGALLVIWGTVFVEEGKTWVYFELADRLGIAESSQARPYRAEPLLYEPVTGRVECVNCIDLRGEVTRRTYSIAWFALGLAHYVAQQPEAARSEFLTALYCAGEAVDRSLLPARPDCIPVEEPDLDATALIRYYLGKTDVLLGDYRGGIAELSGAAESNPNDPTVWLAIGEAYSNWYSDALPNPPSAQSAFAQAQRAANALPVATLGRERASALGRIHELQGDYAAAVAEYQKAVERFATDDPGGYVSLLALARAQTQAGQADAATANLHRAADLLPDAPWAYLELARLQTYDRAGAEVLIQQARAAAPNEAYVAITQAEMCVEWGDRACAADAYTQAFELRPNSGWLHSRVGDFYLPTDPPVAGQSWEEAERHYRAAADLRPADPWVHQRLGYVLLNLGQNAEAAAEYEAAISLLPDDLPPGELACTLALAQERAGFPVTGECPQQKSDQ